LGQGLLWLVPAGLGLRQPEGWQLDDRERGQVGAGNDLADRGIKQVAGIEATHDKNQQKEANKKL
jgi:hypothetical protein